MRFTSRHTLYINAPQRVVYAVLTNYRHFEAWMPDVVRSRLLAREGEVAVAELIVPPHGAEKLILELVESPSSSVAFTQVDRLREDGVSGRFDLSPTEDVTRTKVTAELGMKIGPHRLACRRRLEQVAEHTLTALVDRALKLQTSGLSEVPDQRAKILEIEVAAGDVTMRVAGTTYELVRRRRAPPA